MSSSNGLIELDNLVDLVFEGAFNVVLKSVGIQLVNHDISQLIVANSFGLETWEEITDQTIEEWHIIEYKLRHVHVSQGSHEDHILWHIGVLSLELSSHDKDGLECTKLEIIMMLLGQLLLGELVKSCHLLGKNLSLGESFRHEHVLTDEKQLWHNHDHRSEESLQVVWQFGSASISGIHGNEDSYGWHQFHVYILEYDLGLSFNQSILDGLDLNGDDRKYFNIDSVELIEASPETSLDQTGEYLLQTLRVHILSTIGNNTADTHRLGKILDSLCLTSSCWTCWLTS